MHHKKCKNGGFRAFSLKQNVVIVRCVIGQKDIYIIEATGIFLVVQMCRSIVLE